MGDLDSLPAAQLDDREILKRFPVEDGLDRHRVLAVMAVVAGPRPGAPAGTSLRAYVLVLPQRALLRIVQPIPHDGRRRCTILRDDRIGLVGCDEHAPPLNQFLVALEQIDAVRLDRAEVLVLFKLWMQAVELSADVLEALLGEERVRA